MTTETSLDDETWNSVTEQTILLHDGLKYVADLVSPPEFLPKLSSFDLIDSDIEFRFDPTWIAKLSESLQTSCSVEHSPYHLFFDFRQRSIIALWQVQQKCLHNLSNDQSNGESCTTSSEATKTVSFTSHISLLLLLPLLQSQARTDPSLQASCILLLLNFLKECSPNSLSGEPLACTNGLEELLYSWIETEPAKETLSSESEVNKEDIIAALTALACGRLSLKSFIQLLLILLKHRTSLPNIAIGNVIHNALKYISSGNYTKPSLLRTSYFTTQWPCNPFPDLPVNLSVEERCPSISCNGKYLFVTNTSGKGLAKIGTGKFGSFRGFLYSINLYMEEGWVAWNGDHLLFRPQTFDTGDNNNFCLVLDPSSLQIKETVELHEAVVFPVLEDDTKIQTIQFTSDGVHLYWIFTSQTSPANQELPDYKVYVWEFKLEMEINESSNILQRYTAVPVRQPVIINIRQLISKVKDGPIQFNAAIKHVPQPYIDLGLTQERLLQTTMFVNSNMLVMISPHSPMSDPKVITMRSKKNPVNCCFSLLDGQLMCRESVTDTTNNTWQSFFMPRLGICCDSSSEVLWTFGHGKIHEWIDSGYPCLNQVMQQLSIQDDSIDLSSTSDVLSPDEMISFITIEVSILSKTLDSQLNASLAMNTAVDGTCIKLIYDVLQLALVGKHHSTIVCLLQALQPLLKSNAIKPDPQLVKGLRSILWMLVCSYSTHISQIQTEACKSFVCGLGVFYSEPKEQSALLVVLLSEKDSSGVLMLRDMLLSELARQLVAVKSIHDAPNKLAYDAVSKLIKTCVTESSRKISLCGSLNDEEFFNFTASQPETSAALTYISTLVLKTWKDLMLSEDCMVDGTLAEMSEFISKNVEPILLANKIFEACQKLFEEIFEVLKMLQDKEKDMIALRLNGLDKVIKATPIGQVLVFFVTILTHPKFCSLPLASGLLSLTIAATKTAKLFCRLQEIANQTGEESRTCQSLMSSLPDLSIWTRSSKVESIHPIRDDYKLTKTVTFKGAKCLYVKFDPRCATQYQYDKVLVYAGPTASGKIVGEYGGNSYGYGSKGVICLGWPKNTVTVEGESVTFNFQVKSSRERITPDRAVWGLACTVSLKKDEDEADGDVCVPVTVDIALGLLYLNYRLLSVLYDGPLTISEEDTCKHLLNSQLLQRCVWEKTKTTPLQDSEACGITITVTPDPDKSPPALPQPRQKLSQELIKRLRDASGILAPTLRPSIRQALQTQAIEEVTLSAVIRHLDLSDMVHGLELLQVIEFESSKYLKLCDTMRDVFRRLDGILRQLQAMAEVELRWSQEIDDIRQGLLQPSAAFFNEYHLQEVKSKDLELLCNLKEIDFDPMEQEQVVGKLIELLECDAKSNGVQYDSDDLLSRMPKTRAMRHSLMECGELLCSVTIKNDYKKGPPGRSVSQGTFNALNIENLKTEDKTALFYRSLSAPSQLHRSLSVQEGAKDLRRLQRWRTAVQKKNKSLSVTSHPEGVGHSVDYGTIVDDIFAFIGSDRDKAVSCASFLTAARIRNDRGLSRVQALLHMRDLVNMCNEMPGSLPNLLHTVASILSRGPRVEELKCGGLVETVREEFSNVVQSLLQQASNDPLTYSNSIITLSLCPFSWQDERCVIRSGVVALLDKLCVLGRDKSGASRNVSSMAWAGFQVLLNRFVQWETDQDYRAGAIEWSGQAYQVSSLITNYLNTVLQDGNRNNPRTRDALQHVLKLLQSIAKSKMGEAILQQSCTVSTLLAVLRDRRSPPKLVLAVLRLCHVALPLMTETSCQELSLPCNNDSYLGNRASSLGNSDSSLENSDGSLRNSDGSLRNSDGSLRNSDGSLRNSDGSLRNSEGSLRNSGSSLGDGGCYSGNGDLRADVKVAKLLLMKLGEFALPFTPLEENGKGVSEEERPGSVIDREQYSMYAHKRVNQPAHEVVHKVMSIMREQVLVLGPGIGEEVVRAVQFDNELTNNNQVMLITDNINACQAHASRLAKIGLVTSIAPANHDLETSEDEKDLETSEEVCHLRNRKLASESCQPFVSGQVALAMASEVISLIQCLLSSCCSDGTTKLWSNAIKVVLCDALNLVPSLMGSITENIDQFMQFLQSDKDDDAYPESNVELISMSRQVMAALCVLGGFKQNIYAGCKAKIIGEDMEPFTCEVTHINDLNSTATVILENGGGERHQSSLDIPLARLELTNKQIVSVDKLGLVENTLEALVEILKTRDVTLPYPNAIHDSNAVLVRTCSARILCEMKTRASMALACQMKVQSFSNVFSDHHSRPIQTIQTLANDSDPGQRLSVLEGHCQELRKLFKDLTKPSDRSLKGKVKDVILDVTKDYPPVQGVVMSEGYRMAHLVCEGASVESLPRGSYIYSSVSIPVKAPSFYWEVEVLSLGMTEDTYASSGSSLSIGLVPAITHSPGQWSTPVGSCLLHDNGIAVHYKRGSFTAWETISTGLVLKVNHVIGCGYMRSEDNVGTVYFTHNGQRLPGSLNDVNAGLWPVVHLQKKNVKVLVNFGNRPFKYAKGSKIRQAADLVTDSMEEIRNMLQELPFTGVDEDSDDEPKPEPRAANQDDQSKPKKVPEPLQLTTAAEFREYDPSSSLNYLLSSSYDVMTDIGPSPRLKEDDRQTESLDHKTANPTELLVKAWEEKVFPVIRRRFRNEGDRRSGLEQIRGALQAGLMDIAIATLEDLYEDSGGIPNSLIMPRLEDVKEDVNKITISTIKQDMSVMISTNLLDPLMSGFVVPDMKKTAGLNGIVIAVDKTQKLVEVQTYNREEGHLTRFWYPINVLERPSSGLARSSSFLAMRSDDITQVDAQRELLTCERELTRLNCRRALVEALRTPTLSENDGLDLVKTLSSHLLRGPYCNGSTTAASLSTVPSPSQCLSLSNLLPSALLYFEPPTMTNEVHRLLDTASLLGEDEIVKLTNTLCQGLKEPTIFHREFYVSHDTFEEEVYFNDAAVTIVTCWLNPAVHTGWVNSRNPLVTILCYYGGPILNKSNRKARYMALQYPEEEPENQDKYPSKILPTNRVIVRYEKHSMVGPIVDLHGLSSDVLLGLVFIECFIDKLSDDLKAGSHTKDPVGKSSLQAAIYTVTETASKFILKTNLPPCVKQIVFHLLAQLLRLNHKLESMSNNVPSQAYTTQLILVLTRLAPLKTELQKLLDKEISVSNESALEFILKGNFENDKFTSYLQALFAVVLAMAEVTPLSRDRSGWKRNRQGSLAEGELLQSHGEVVLSPSSFTFASFDFKSDSETPPASPLTSPTAVVPHTPPSHSRPRRRGSLRKRKRAYVQEIVSPTETMPWFDAVVSTTLLLRYLQENDPRGAAVIHDSLLAVANAKLSSVIQRILVITNIPQTMERQQVIDTLKKACKPSGGIFEERTYLPELSEAVEQQEKPVEENWEPYFQLLPSAKANKQRRIRGYAVIELRNSSQVDLARQAIVTSKSLRESSTEHDNIVGIAKVNSDLLMAGTNELEAFAVFDEFLVNKLYKNGELSLCALVVMMEIFNSCSTALSQPEPGRDTPSPSLTPRPETAPQPSVSASDGDPRKDEDDEAFEDDAKPSESSNKPNSSLQETTSREHRPYQEITAKGDNILPPLPPLQVLTEDHICTSSSSNLLGVFLQSFCHNKQTIRDVVHQVVQDCGVSMSDEQHPCLTVDGFIEWVKAKGRDNVRSVWKAIFACGYDLQFQRCTFIFPKDILEDHSNWSLAKDKTLINFVDHKCRALSTSPSRLMPDELHITNADLASEQFAHLQDLSLLSIRSRFAFLKSVNQTIEHLVLPMADLQVTDTHSLSTGALLKMASGLMFYDTKMAFLNRTLDHSSQRRCPNSSPELSLDPLETLEADKVSSSSQFNQAASYLSSVPSAGLRVKVASGGDPTFPLKVQLRGEQVLGSGGSFRHFMWLMARELQSQHINLLIPCPSTAANKNKGMLVLRPGPMSYSEEKLLVFFGQLLGIALRSDIPFAVDLMPVFWKSLLGLPLDAKTDLYETDILTYNYVRRFSEVESREEFSTLCYEADLCPYRFVYTSLNGQEIELCPDGANKSVTWENHHEYVELIRELRLKELGCKSRMAAVCCGLYSVIPLHDLCVLQPSDLQKRTCGIPNVDLDFLKAHTTYVAGVRETEPHIEFFWNTLESFSQDQLCKFVKFACNQERLPSTCTCQKGTPSTADVHVPPYPMKIGPPDGTGRSDARYIRVETCMFMVKLPRYSTQEITNQKLSYAINCREDPLTDI